MQIGLVELHDVPPEALDDWERDARTHFRGRDGGCSARGDRTPPALFFTLPNGRPALDAFTAHVRSLDRPGRPRFMLLDEEGDLQPVPESSGAFESK